MLGDNVEARQTELTALVNALHQDIREQTRNESSPVAERVTRSATHDSRVSRITREFVKERKRKRSMVYVRVPKLSKRRMREYKLIREDMLAKVSLDGRGQDVPNTRTSEIATQDQVQADGTNWERDDAEQAPVDSIDPEQQDSVLGNSVNEIQTDDPQGDEAVTFFDEDKHRREQYDEVRKMLDAMVRRSLQQNSSRHVSAMEKMTDTRSTDIRAFSSLVPNDDGRDDVGLEQDVHRWLAGEEHAGSFEAECDIAEKVNNVEDNALVDPSEVSKQDKPRQKAKKAKMKRKSERAERGSG